MSIKENLIQCLLNTGISLIEEDWDEPLDRLFSDSLSFISAIAEIESCFGIALPDIFLTSREECSLRSMENTIASMLENDEENVAGKEDSL